MSSLVGKRFVITGANTGIGRVTAETLAARGAHVVFACRSEDKTRPIVEAVQAAHGAKAASFLPIDLSELASVRKAADTLLEAGEPIDGLINNAGLAGLRGLTKDGFELAFGTNHLGPFLFTTRLVPLLEKAAAPRVVNVASKAHYRVKAIDWSVLRTSTPTTTGFPEYGVSKLANVLFTAEAARRFDPRIKNYALHPGVVASDVWREVPSVFRGLIKLFMLSNEEGAQTSLYCATSEACKEDNGLYYDRSASVKASRLARDEALAKKLWERSVEWTTAK
jgi:retinol dehydrogenase 12